MAKDPIKKAENGTYYFRANLGFHQSFLFLSQTEHRFYKIIPKSGIKPCGTDNHCFFAILQCIRFTGQLGLAVNRIGTRNIPLIIRKMFRAIEHIIR